MLDWQIKALGFAASLLFFSRTLVQWFQSERAGKVVSPILYWQFSLLAAVLMFTYGILRNDLAIAAGQLLTYAVYVRNLQFKRAWRSMPLPLRLVFLALPVAVIGWMAWQPHILVEQLLKNEDIPAFWLWWGLLAHVVFTFRFVVQWMVSERKKNSELPLGFWVISALGSLMILAYALFRKDPVLLASHSLGIFLYFRNIRLHLAQKTGP
jgi:lipid-A-disaccharide synthase-like uncharacterized protein